MIYVFGPQAILISEYKNSFVHLCLELKKCVINRELKPSGPPYFQFRTKLNQQQDFEIQHRENILLNGVNIQKVNFVFRKSKFN